MKEQTFLYQFVKVLGQCPSRRAYQVTANTIISSLLRFIGQPIATVFTCGRLFYSRGC